MATLCQLHQHHDRYLWHREQVHCFEVDGTQRARLLGCHIQDVLAQKKLLCQA